MAYFIRRNNLQTEYSGYEEISDGLKRRLRSVCDKYLGEGERLESDFRLDSYVRKGNLRHDLMISLGEEDLGALINGSDYARAFEAIEIYFDIAKRHTTSYGNILVDLVMCFQNAGSVYSINKDGEVFLQPDEELASDLQEIKDVVLSEYDRASNIFLEGVNGVINRKSKPKDAVKNLWVAFEEYVKNKTGSKKYEEAVDKLRSGGIIAATQKALWDKLYAFRSDMHGATHSGNSPEPDELDALWFLESVIPQLKFIHRKLSDSQNAQS